MEKKWIAGAIRHPGALTAAAAKAGKSLDEYCASGNLSGKESKRCALRKTLMGFNK